MLFDFKKRTRLKRSWPWWCWILTALNTSALVLSIILSWHYIEVDAFKTSCEPAKIGLAVWMAMREMFPVFKNWMFTFKSGSSWDLVVS